MSGGSLYSEVPCLEEGPHSVRPMTGDGGVASHKGAPVDRQTQLKTLPSRNLVGGQL